MYLTPTLEADYSSDHRRTQKLVDNSVLKRYYYENDFEF